MVMITHEFPNAISALRFEWAWQNPNKSRRLAKVLRPKRASETALQFRIRILATMLRSGPWNRLPLVVRFLKPEFRPAEFGLPNNPDWFVPTHMSIVDGPVIAVRQKASSSAAARSRKPARSQATQSQRPEMPATCEPLATQLATQTQGLECDDQDNWFASQMDGRPCYFCKAVVRNDPQRKLVTALRCTNPVCSLVAHTTCCASFALKQEAGAAAADANLRDQDDTSRRKQLPEVASAPKTCNSQFLIPLELRCPQCACSILWGELIKRAKIGLDIRTPKRVPQSQAQLLQDSD